MLASTKFLLGLLFAFVANISAAPNGYAPSPSGETSSRIMQLGFTYQLTVDVEQVNNTVGCVNVPGIQLHEAFWDLEVCKTANSHLDVYLRPVTSNETWNKSPFLLAEATVTLLSNDNTTNIVRSVPKTKFKINSTDYSIEQFINWSDLAKNYVKKGKFVFEVEIMASPSLNPEQNIEATSIKLHLTLDNVDQLKTHITPEVNIQGVNWTFNFTRAGSDLEISLQADEKDLELSTFYAVNATAAILPASSQVDTDRRRFTHKYHYGSNRAGFHSSDYTITWSYFMNYYVVNNKANFIIDFSVELIFTPLK